MEAPADETLGVADTAPIFIEDDSENDDLNNGGVDGEGAGDPAQAEAAAAIQSHATRHKPVIIDNRGDLTLIVGRERKVFIVDSRALARSSKMWNDMIDVKHKHRVAAAGPQAEGADTQDLFQDNWEITLDLGFPAQYEDKVEVLKVLLYAAHGRLDLIPAKPTLSDLCFMLMLSNKFDMMSVMGSQIQNWYAQMRSSTTGLRQRSLTELRITWEYGVEADFQRAGNVFVWYAASTTMAPCTGSSRDPRTTTCWRMTTPSRSLASSVRPRPRPPSPPSPMTTIACHITDTRADKLAESVKKRRQGILHMALRTLGTKIRLLQGPRAGSKRRHVLSAIQSYSCLQDRRNDECDSYHLGLLMRALVAEDITPHALPPASSICESLHDFNARLTRVYDVIAEAVPLLGKVHAKCNPVENIITRLKEERDTYALDLTMTQKDYFKMQTAKRPKKD